MRIILIDAKNAILRFGSVHPNLKTSDGIRTGAVYGLVNCLLRLKKKFPVSRFVLVWDGEGKSWRHTLYPEYKSNRKRGDAAPQAIQDVLCQLDTVERLANTLDILQIKIPNVEADDVIGILATRCLKRRWTPVIYSSDADFMQLMANGVQVIRDVARPETVKSVVARFGCTPDKLLAVRALAGDKSDNIPNAYRGCGPKTALELVRAGLNPASRYGLSGTHESFLPLWPKIRLNYRLLRILTTTKTKVLPSPTKQLLRAGIACILSELVTLMGAGNGSNRRAVISALASLELAEAMREVTILSRLQR